MDNDMVKQSHPSIIVSPAVIVMEDSHLPPPLTLTLWKKKHMSWVCIYNLALIMTVVWRSSAFPVLLLCSLEPVEPLTRYQSHLWLQFGPPMGLLNCNPPRSRRSEHPLPFARMHSHASLLEEVGIGTNGHRCQWQIPVRRHAIRDTAFWEMQCH